MNACDYSIRRFNHARNLSHVVVGKGTPKDKMADDKSVQEFVNLTGASVEIARSLLEACSGNLELAIGMHLDSMPVPSDLQNRGLEEPDPAPSSAPSTYEET